MSYFPNADAVLYFVRDILPLIRRDYPQITFDVVGRFPPRVVRRLHGKGGVRVLGEVPDLGAHVVRADISVAPLRIARGVQNKVLEAMAMGVPVVATPEAVEGITIDNGEEVLIGDSPAKFASHVVALLRDRRLRNHLAKKAKSRVTQSYSWRKAHTRLDELIRDVSSDDSRGVA
jgi:glycosyltransferase involved in cell wall biosynthesis